MEISKTMGKINETKVGSLKDKNDKPLARLIKKKGRAQINTVRNEKGEGIMNSEEMQRITVDNYKQLYDDKMDNLIKWTNS